MKCMKVKKTIWSAMAAMVLVSAAGLAQTPAAPATPAAPQAGTGQVKFPKVDLKNFTADTPTTAEVDTSRSLRKGHRPCSLRRRTASMQ
jgi:hypothetical protein